MESQHTQGRLVVRQEFGQQSLAIESSGALQPLKIHTPFVEGAWEDDCEANGNMRRIAACWNFCESIATEKLESQTIAEYIAGEAYLNAFTASKGAANFDLQGSACRVLAASFAGQFKGSGAINYLEIQMAHEEIGEFTVTMQRKQGETPAQKLNDALRSLDFYKSRVDALQQWQSKMRDPERTIVCDILANGQTLEPAGDRYTITPAQSDPNSAHMAAQALAGEIIEALLADEKDGGYDLTAGMFGRAFSQLVRRLAESELNASQQPPAVHLMDGVIEVRPIGYHSLQLIFDSQPSINNFMAALPQQQTGGASIKPEDKFKVQQWLDALVVAWQKNPHWQIAEAITALRELLEGPERETITLPEEVQRYSPNGEGGMEVDSLGAWVKWREIAARPTDEPDALHLAAVELARQQAARIAELEIMLTEPHQNGGAA